MHRPRRVGDRRARDRDREDLDAGRAVLAGRSRRHAGGTGGLRSRGAIQSRKDLPDRQRLRRARASRAAGALMNVRVGSALPPELSALVVENEDPAEWAVGGRVPLAVFAPGSIAEASTTLRAAGQAGLAVAPFG